MMTRQVTLLLLVASTVAHGSQFLGRRDFDPAHISTVIQEALDLDGMLGSGHGIDKSRLSSINATLAPIFDVLPKNEHGRLSAPYFRYAVQRYFSQRQGWVIKGFEPQEEEKSDIASVQGALVMQDKIPGYVEAQMQKKFSHGGFALQDMVIAVASMEALVFDEVIEGVETAYFLNKLSTSQLINIAPNLTHTLSSYFLVEHLDGNRTSIAQHWAEKREVKSFYPHFPDTLKFIKDLILEDHWMRKPSKNPFQPFPRFAFEDVVLMARTFSETFGAFSNHECHDMKMKLAEMDVHGTGRVKLADFYRSSQGGAWQFLETPEYLSSIGALDKSSDSLGPQVIIPNYIMGPNNCISSSVYYDVCCLSECDGIYQHLEARIKAPTASAAQVVRVIQEGIATSPLLSSSAPIEPRNLSAPLLERLEQVAAHHNDMIPLHGRLFAQWLHYAFPQECPYPHMSGAVGGRMTLADRRKINASSSVTQEEKERLIESDAGSAPSPEAGLDMWIMEEELLGDSPSASRKTFGGSCLRSLVPALGFVSLLAISLKEVLRLVRAGALWHGVASKKVVEYDV